MGEELGRTSAVWMGGETAWASGVEGLLPTRGCFYADFYAYYSPASFTLRAERAEYA
jgi:hypothetical protein